MSHMRASGAAVIHESGRSAHSVRPCGTGPGYRVAPAGAAAGNATAARALSVPARLRAGSGPHLSHGTKRRQ